MQAETDDARARKHHQRLDAHDCHTEDGGVDGKERRAGARGRGRDGRVDGAARERVRVQRAAQQRGQRARRRGVAALVRHGGDGVAQAEREGIDKVFTAAGFEWREPGCSMCLGMNEDQLSPGERCASTSNRNF
jgi:hypothetical protein